MTLLFEELDEDGDGKVSFDEFLHGLFVAKDSQDAVDGEEWIDPVQADAYHSTPFSQQTGPRSKVNICCVLYTHKHKYPDSNHTICNARYLPRMLFPQHVEIDVDKKAKVDLHHLTNLAFFLSTFQVCF